MAAKYIVAIGEFNPDYIKSACQGAIPHSCTTTGFPHFARPFGKCKARKLARLFKGTAVPADTKRDRRVIEGYIKNAPAQWESLKVTDATSGEAIGSLLGVVEFYSHMLNAAEIVNGKIEAWPGFFLSAPGEDPNRDAPQKPVDWDGFTKALQRFADIRGA